MRTSWRYALLTIAWTAAAALVLIAPGNLVMRLAFGKYDDPALVRQALLAGAGLLLAVVTVRFSTRTAPRPPELRPDGTVGPPTWARVVTWAAAAVPVLGFSVPHLLWGLGVPFGVAAQAGTELAALGDSAVFWVMLVIGPLAGALLTLGLVSRWGRTVPGWVPLSGRRRVPRVLAVVPATLVGLLVGQYGAMMTTCLAFGITRTCAPGGDTQILDGSWGFAGTYPVFLLWGGFLLAAAVGYVHTTSAHAGR
ncbi:hypothetical protein [Nonomuraea sp. B5E05]|uniref:hypothetical protein n=1 Tax=Nonomuraea sp. B5E05 TaxID=3153569 RepID=UPI003261C697